jgi:transcription elongation factor GreA
MAKTTSKKATKASAGQSHDEEILITQEGLDALKSELAELKTSRRKEVAQRLKEAISYGDLSENSEFEEARNEQAFVESRIAVVEQQIKHAKVISGANKHVKVIQVGHAVTLLNTQSDQEEVYNIVGSTEADPLNGKISNESPVGKGVPEGIASYEIVKID